MKGRSRIIKHEFFTNENIAEMDYRTRLFFIGLFTIADKEGRFEIRKKIKALIFPYDDLTFENILEMLSELEAYGFVKTYDLKRFGQIVNWKKHQKPHWNETESEIPTPQQLSFVEPNNNEDSSHKVNKDKSKRESKNKRKSISIRDQEIYDEIVSHLNEVADKGFFLGDRMSLVYIREIKKQLAKDYEIKHFKYVNLIKSEEWKGDEKMDTHLNPKTLYCDEHFETYLNQKPKMKGSKKQNKNKKAVEDFIKNG